MTADPSFTAPFSFSAGMLSDFDGVAFLCDADGTVIYASDKAKAFEKNESVQIEFGKISQFFQKDPTPLFTRLSMDMEGSKKRVCDVVAFPLTDRRFVILGRDVSMETAFQSALLESRQRYKDFVEVSSDFAWETDAKGEFVFISPQGALGYPVEALIHKKPDQFFETPPDATVAAFVSPFLVRQPVSDMGVRFTRADGQIADLKISARPLVDDDGNWHGARGVCHDVTALRERDEAIEKARAREQLLSLIIQSFRDEVDPQRMLSAAAKAAARGLKASGCQILRMRSRLADEDAPLAQGFEVSTKYGDVGGREYLLGILADLALESGVVTQTYAHWTVLAVATRYGGEENGALCVWRHLSENSDWTEEDRHLFTDVAAQMGVALEQVAQHEHVFSLARTDSLTGLLNRRAFYEEAGRAYSRANEAKASSTILYIDLDNFKAVNDVKGHQAGDKALLAVRDILLHYTRPGDLVSRLGGDEFAVWLQGADAVTAEKRATDILAQTDGLQHYAGSPDKPLSFSIGVAEARADVQEGLNALILRADEAMYASKSQGKGRYVVAVPPQEGEAS